MSTPRKEINLTYLDYQQELLMGVYKNHDSTPPDSKPSCDMTHVSHFPYKLFRNVYSQFCKEVDSKYDYQDTTWMVDSAGNRIPPRKNKVQQRSPPENPEAYKDYRINLFFSPDVDTRFTCGKKCKDAFDLISESPCNFSHTIC
jgi:hypothetical protein